MNEFLYVYANASGHHHVSIKRLTDDEMTLNLYKLKGVIGLKKYLKLMNETVTLIGKLNELRNEFKLDCTEEFSE